MCGKDWVDGQLVSMVSRLCHGCGVELKHPESVDRGCCLECALDEGVAANG